ELGARGMPVGYLWHNKWPDGQHRLVATEKAAQAAGVLLRPRGISDIGELDAIVSDLRSNGITIIIVQPSPFTYRHRNRIFESMTNNGLENICAWPPGPEEGAVIGYGPDYADIYRRAGSYISRILAGRKASGPASSEPDQVSARDQPECSEGPRCRYPRQVACGGRRGDRMSVANSSRVSLF